MYSRDINVQEVVYSSIAVTRAERNTLESASGRGCSAKPPQVEESAYMPECYENENERDGMVGL
jgi:hypothetical protein